MQPFLSYFSDIKIPDVEVYIWVDTISCLLFRAGQRYFFSLMIITPKYTLDFSLEQELALFSARGQMFNMLGIVGHSFCCNYLTLQL